MLHVRGFFLCNSFPNHQRHLGFSTALFLLLTAVAIKLLLSLDATVVFELLEFTLAIVFLCPGVADDDDAVTDAAITVPLGDFLSANILQVLKFSKPISRTLFVAKDFLVVSTKLPSIMSEVLFLDKEGLLIE